MSSFTAPVCSWQNRWEPLTSFYLFTTTMKIGFQNSVFFVVYFICLWVAISFVISLVGGWFELGRVYRAAKPFQGERWRFQDAYLRLLTSYRGVLTVGADAEGLYASVFAPFRIGHPPLFIPWQDISVQLGKCLWVRVYKFEFRQVPSVRLQLREKLGKKIQIAAGASWPGDRGTAGSAF